jgi:TLD
MSEEETIIQAIDKTHLGVQVPEPMVMSRSGSPQGSFRTTHSNPMPLQHPSLPFSGNPLEVSPSPRRSLNNGTPVPSKGGILAGPLAWVQRNRETRRRLQLQQEAEEQLRKIAEGEGLTRHHNHHHHHNHNHHNYYHHNPATTTCGSGDSVDNDSAEEDYRIGVQHLSKSGEGMSAELEFVGDDDNNDIYTIPPVRIHEESRMITAQQQQQHVSDMEPPESPTKTDFKPPEYILTPEQMHHIAMHVLPKTIAYCQWKRLYSLNRDGDSFDGCLRIIANVPRTLVVVRTTKGAVFGGYADSPWRQMEVARFYGSAQACLFSVKEPNTPLDQVENPNNLLNVYPWSGKNRYIQVCDTSNKMLAFGGGGSDGAFGLCIQEDFQTGSTGTCDTFDNAPLCDESPFNVVDMEIWEFLTGVF